MSDLLLVSCDLLNCITFVNCSRHPGGNYPLLDWPEEYIKCSSSIFVRGFETPSGGYGTRYSHCCISYWLISIIT